MTGRQERAAIASLGVAQIAYDWIKKEGIPLYEGLYTIEDITELPRQPWARLGGKGTFIQLEPTRTVGKLHYVAEIPSGGALEPEKHLYDEVLYILQGRGLAEVWQVGGEKRKLAFEWGEGSLFAVPNNAWHRLVNGGREPVLIFGQTNAPVVMEALQNLDIIFNCDYNFTDRFGGEGGYFVAGARGEGDNVWKTNFVPDVRTCFINPVGSKVEDGGGLNFAMATYYGGHVMEWPSGVYHKAHYHMAGAVIQGLSGEGYCLLWHRRYGLRPYQDGHGDKVIKAEWKKHSIYSPQNEVFHTHFTTGKEPARQLRWVGGGSSFAWARSRFEEEQVRKFASQGRRHSLVSFREGGTMIEYEDEDPEIRRAFKEELQRKGVEFKMKPVVYRTDTFRESF